MSWIVTCPGADEIALDCNGNHTDDFCDVNAFFTSQDADGDGIPDECDFTTYRRILWDGFDASNPGIHADGLDYDGDGVMWHNPSSSWIVVIGATSCPLPAQLPSEHVQRLQVFFQFLLRHVEERNAEL